MHNLRFVGFYIVSAIFMINEQINKHNWLTEQKRKLPYVYIAINFIRIYVALCPLSE